MAADSPMTDRRATLKERRRRAILDAAMALIIERGRPRFSVDELAERADVSRRTIFNHFDSLDDVVLTVASETLEESLQALDVTGATGVTGASVSGTRSAFFDDIAQVLRRADLPRTITTLYWTLCGTDSTELGEDPRQKELVARALNRAAEHLSAQVARRRPGMDRLDIDLLVTALTHGIGVIAERWLTSTEDLGGPDARASWDALVDRLLHSVRTGYLPER